MKLPEGAREILEEQGAQGVQVLRSQTIEGQRHHLISVKDENGGFRGWWNEERPINDILWIATSQTKGESPSERKTREI